MFRGLRDTGDASGLQGHDKKEFQRVVTTWRYSHAPLCLSIKLVSRRIISIIIPSTCPQQVKILRQQVPGFSLIDSVLPEWYNTQPPHTAHASVDSGVSNEFMPAIPSTLNAQPKILNPQPSTLNRPLVLGSRPDAHPPVGVRGRDLRLQAACDGGFRACGLGV